MRKPILYSFRRCPYAMRARIIILVSEICLELREIKLSDKPIEMTNISRKGTVPVLQLPDGQVIDESLDVMNWALNINDPAKLKKSIKDNIEDTRYFLDKFDTDFKYHLDRYKYYTRYNSENKLPNKENHRDLALGILKTIEKKFNKNLWIFGNNVSYLDIAILPFIRQYRIADTEWFDKTMPLKNTREWLMRFLEWEIFNKSMHKYKLWNPKNQPTFYGKNIFEKRI